jgi:hypothetical protein
MDLLGMNVDIGIQPASSQRGHRDMTSIPTNQFSGSQTTTG